MNKSSFEDTMNRGTVGLMQVFTPRRSVITDMIMVQFISVIIACFGVLIFSGQGMNTTDVTVYMIAIFVSLIFITSLYAKITR
tara:strand:- start:656 stop:904 length:249 start_codon:yes stop_codon:yes gene_type:complete